MRYLILLLILISPLQAAAGEFDKIMKTWEQVLQTFVDQQGRTDFKALGNSAQQLQQVSNYLANNGPSTTPEQFNTRELRLAYHINAYNALAMQAIIDKGIPKDFNSVFKRLRFFRWHKILVDGKETTLHAYENDVIRAIGEPRIHFVLNCMVRDCPRLPREPFIAAQLEAQLDSATREFFNKRKHLYIDADNKTVYVSQILEFYAEDFVSSGEEQQLREYINRYRNVALHENYLIAFIPYDWTVNQAP